MFSKTSLTLHFFPKTSLDKVYRANEIPWNIQLIIFSIFRELLKGTD